MDKASQRQSGSSSALKKLWIARHLGLGVFLLALLCCALLASFIPKQYTGTATVVIEHQSERPHTIEHTSIASAPMMHSVITHMNLSERGEINMRADINASHVTKLLRRIQNIIKPTDHLSDQDLMTAHMLRSISLTTRQESAVRAHIGIQYQSTSRHLARAIANLIARKYAAQPAEGAAKHVIEMKELPMTFSTPDLKTITAYSLIFSSIVSILCVLCVMPFITRMKK